MKKMLARKPFSRMEGLTLLETMFALAVGALVLIGAVIFYMSTKQSANASKSVGDMNAIVAGYQSYIAGGNTMTSATTLTDIQSAGFLPTPLYDAWGQAYTVDSTTTPGVLAITIPGIAGATYTAATDSGAASATGDKNCAAIYMMATSSGAPVSSTTVCSVKYTL